MTPAMLEKAASGSVDAGATHVEFREGLAEKLPVDDSWADVVISNGVINLCPDKMAAFREIHRVLKPGGKMQIGDIIVQTEVPPAAKEDIDLWTG
ncbi:MAG: methyltransferase domain-containing protein [SAR202 cluster bacterium]|mgnify:FL=1|nr:methyltransferase domain-containing protein [SAR202 cluster bacterium]|tara:strand:+ start:9537 stop:9821 length:285 start_codon:yes stop_codon:yes gene_type:complete